MPANPPQYQPVVYFRRKFRYYAALALAGTLNEGQLISICGGICTVGNTSVVSFANSIRLHGVKIWGVAAANGGTSVVSLRWIGTQSAAVDVFASMQLISDSSTNASYAPHIHARPPKGSTLSMMLTADNSGADNVLYIIAPQYSVIEFDVEFNHGFPPALGSFTWGPATGACTLGVTYWPTYTLSSGTGSMVPQDLATC